MELAQLVGLFGRYRFCNVGLYGLRCLRRTCLSGLRLDCLGGLRLGFFLCAQGQQGGEQGIRIQRDLIVAFFGSSDRFAGLGFRCCGSRGFDRRSRGFRLLGLLGLRRRCLRTLCCGFLYG